MKHDETIITYDNLTDKVSQLYTNVKDLELIHKAFMFASNKHEGMLRNSGEEFINHPLNVAYILADLKVDAITIVAALLHEILDTNTTLEELNQEFGEEIASLCENLNKINKLELQKDNEQSAINFRKIIVGLTEDVRVLFVRLADRLHNMRTLWALKDSKQKNTAYETEQVLIPIAHRLGINSIKSELEDLCLQYTKPDIYKDIVNNLAADKEDMEKLLNEMKESISNILTEHNIKFEIKGRVKSIHSIYKKLCTGRDYNDIYDILALRIFVEEEKECYLAMGLIHAKYRPIPKRFKDYITMPKKNMYQSLHTSVFGIDGHLFEIQIRTYEMDEIAEKGIASHWSYKEKGSKATQSVMEQKLELFRNLIEANNNDSDTEFVQNVENEFLSDFIYISTPKGDIVELPKGSTPIDFAYRIHSNVGDTTVGAIVNGKIATLDSKLNDKDIVEIMTLKTTKPNKNWLNFVKTSQARNKIKAYFSKQDRENYIEKGKQLLEKELRKQKLNFNEILNDKNKTKILNDLKLKTEDDLYLAIGSLRYTPSYIIELSSEDKQNVKDILIDRIINKKNNKDDYRNDIIVAGTDDIKVNLAACCGPVFGDEIIGFITKCSGISIHKTNCHNIANEKQRLINVNWNNSSDKFYYTTIYLEVEKDKNHLLDIITRASLKDVFVEDFKSFNKSNNYVYEIIVKIKNSTALDSFIVDLNNQSFIIKASRLKI